MHAHTLEHHWWASKWNAFAIIIARYSCSNLSKSCSQAMCSSNAIKSNNHSSGTSYSFNCETGNPKSIHGYGGKSLFNLIENSFDVSQCVAQRHSKKNCGVFKSKLDVVETEKFHSKKLTILWAHDCIQSCFNYFLLQLVGILVSLSTRIC